MVLQLLEPTAASTTNITTTTNLVVDLVGSATNGVPTILEPEWMVALNEHDSYHYQEWDGTNGWGIVVQNIHAPAEVVWNTLMDFEAYPTRISKVSSMTPYPPSVQAEEEDAGRRMIFQRMTLVFRWFVSYSFNVRYQVHNPDRHLSWTLDPTQVVDSVLIQSSGYWHVHEHPSRSSSEWSQVVYRNQITMATTEETTKIPKFVRRFLPTHGLQEATRWLKPTSELHYRTGTWRMSNKTDAMLSHEDELCDDGTSSGGGTCLSSNSSTREIMETNPPQTAVSPIGVSRYLLVSTVWGLVVFNTYLYFSHYR